MMSVHVSMNGHEYPSIAAAQRDTGYTYNKIMEYMETGRIVDWRRKGNSPALQKPIIFKGKRYPSLTAAAEAAGISLSAMSRRVKRHGLSGADKVISWTFPVKIDGKVYREIDDLKDIAKLCDSAPSGVYMNLKKLVHSGIRPTVQRLVEMSRHATVHLPMTIRGKKYWHYADIVHDYPYLTKAILRQRIQHHKDTKIDPERLIRPIRSLRKAIEIDGHQFKSIKEASVYYGQNYVGFDHKYLMYKDGKISKEQLIQKNNRNGK